MQIRLDYSSLWLLILMLNSLLCLTSSLEIESPSLPSAAALLPYSRSYLFNDVARKEKKDWVRGKKPLNPPLAPLSASWPLLPHSTSILLCQDHLQGISSTIGPKRRSQEEKVACRSVTSLRYSTIWWPCLLEFPVHNYLEHTQSNFQG